MLACVLDSPGEDLSVQKAESRICTKGKKNIKKKNIDIDEENEENLTRGRDWSLLWELSRPCTTSRKSGTGTKTTLSRFGNDASQYPSENGHPPSRSLDVPSASNPNPVSLVVSLTGI
ncbi:hypothetical protein PUN28_012022 [Cardiocondyla obscurior]|uniref:Uncharacterized protein n=1 Tax=Cardiocondyla obscurior TaxID=286306 RepID=A0AAW2FBW7_9HYME